MIHRLPGRLCAAVLFACLIPVPAALAGASEDLQAFLDGTRTLSARFTQRLVDERAMVIEESEGQLLIRRPGEFRWRYATPFEQVIVSDGERVHIFDADLDQVTVRHATQALSGSPALLLTSTRPLVELFELADAGRAGEFDWVELRPRESEASFTRLRVGMLGKEIAAMDLTDRFGQTTELRFLELDTSPAIADDAFRFTVPQGADVIDETAGNPKP